MNNIYLVQLIAITSHTRSAIFLGGKNAVIFETAATLQIKFETTCVLLSGTYH